MHRNRYKRHSRTWRFLRLTSVDGFTLTEVLVAMFLFSTAVLGVAVGATTVMRANQTSHLQTIATQLAQDQLEVLGAMALAALPACPAFTTPGCSDTYTPPTLGVVFNRSWMIFTANCPPPPAAPVVAGMTCITVQVTWTDYAAQNVTVSSSVRQQ